MTRLIFLDSEFAGRVHELAVETTTVGRDEANQLTILHPSVSAKHCEILVNGPEVIVRDLDSRNGVFINGVRIGKQSEVKSGQVIRFGSVSARLDKKLPPQTDDATSITAVRVLGHLKRQEEAEPAPHAPEHVSLHPMGGQEPAAGDRTVVLPEAAPRARSVASAAGTAQPKPVRNRQNGRLIFLIVVIGVGLAALAYWLWRR